MMVCEKFKESPDLAPAFTQHNKNHTSKVLY